MSESNGVIRVGRKGIKKFAFGEDGSVFSVDVVVAFHEWIEADNRFRDERGDEDRSIPHSATAEYNQMAVDFVQKLSGYGDLSKAEALDFVARLCEQFNELADFFHPKRREEDESPDTSEVELRFSAEPESCLASTN